MMVSLVCAHVSAFAASQTRNASTTGGNYLISEIALSDGTFAAAARTSGKFGSHRLMDRLKTTQLSQLKLNGRPLP
jgi:CO/xanthine dehydrogenase FAD-binding subunit